MSSSSLFTFVIKSYWLGISVLPFLLVRCWLYWPSASRQAYTTHLGPITRQSQKYPINNTTLLGVLKYTCIWAWNENMTCTENTVYENTISIVTRNLYFQILPLMNIAITSAKGKFVWSHKEFAAEIYNERHVWVLYTTLIYIKHNLVCTAGPYMD